MSKCILDWSNEMKKLLTVLLLSLVLINSVSVNIYAKKQSGEWPQSSSAGSVSAESAIVMELNTGTILYEKNIDEKRYPASITKIMTTLLCLENASLTDTVKFSFNAVNSIEYGSSHIGVVADEEIKMEDCLYGIMLMSANEVCNGVAEHISGDIASFVDMMNQKATELGCTGTHFANPNGLYQDDHYTTAHDMALISQAAMKNSMFRKITSTKKYTIPKTNLNEERYLYNKHNMLHPITYPKYGYDYCIGGKTGYTDIARWTLVTFAKKDNMELVCVVMKTNGPPRVEPNEYTDTTKLLNFAFDNFEKYDMDVSTMSDNQEGAYSLFTKYNKFFDEKESPLYLRENAGLVLPKGVDVSAANKSVEYYNNKDFVEGENVIGKITFDYNGINVGTSEILYNTERLEKTDLSRNVTEIVNKVEEENRQKENISDVEEKEEASTPDEDKPSSKKTNVKLIVIVVICLIIVSFAVVVLIWRARLRKRYLGSYGTRSMRSRRRKSFNRGRKRDITNYFDRF